MGRASRQNLIVRSLVFSALVVATLPFSLSAQERRAADSIDVTIVNVDVHVTDRKGNRVTGLRAEDFQVREDGKEQPVTNFSEIVASAPDGTLSNEVAPRSPTRARRTIVLFIEPVILANFRSKQLYDGLRELLRDTVAPGDQVSIVTFARRARVQLEFTDDLSAIERTLGMIEAVSSGVEGRPLDESWSRFEEEASFEEDYEEARQTMGFPPGDTSRPVMTGLAAARRQLFLIRQKAAALESLMQSISGADGKKIVIMATRRFGLYAGAEYFGGTVPGHYQQELDTLEFRQRLIRTANAHGITVYPVHPEGLLWNVDTGIFATDSSVSGAHRFGSSSGQDRERFSSPNQVLLNESAALQEVAHATGGITAWGSANIVEILPRVGEDLGAYYSIGYRATATGKDGARNVVVQTTNRDYVVRSRRQFVEKSDETKMRDRVVANLFQRVGSSSVGIPFEVVMGDYEKIGRNKWSVPVKILIPVGSLTTLTRERAGSAGEFSVYIATGGVLGVMSDVERKSQAFEIQAGEGEKARAGHLTYEITMNVDRAVKQLSIGVMDEVGKEYGIKRFSLPERGSVGTAP